MVLRGLEQLNDIISTDTVGLLFRGSIGSTPGHLLGHRSEPNRRPSVNHAALVCSY